MGIPPPKKEQKKNKKRIKNIFAFEEWCHMCTKSFTKESSIVLLALCPVHTRPLTLQTNTLITPTLQKHSSGVIIYLFALNPLYVLRKYIMCLPLISNNVNKKSSVFLWKNKNTNPNSINITRVACLLHDLLENGKISSHVSLESTIVFETYFHVLKETQ